MSTNKDLFSRIQSMAAADVRNELEANGLPTLGTKAEIVNRLYEFKKTQGKRPFLAPSFSLTVPLSSTPVKGAGGAESEQSRIEEILEDRVKILEDRVTNSLDRIGKQVMLLFGDYAQSKFPEEPASTEIDELHLEEENLHVITPGITESTKLPESVTLLKRKLKMIGTTIELLFTEVENLEKLSNKSRYEMESVVSRLNESERNYSKVVQELIVTLSDEKTVDLEIKNWALFQQEILRYTRKAESYVSLCRKEENDHASQLTESHKNCSRVNHLRLPKFTLPEFSGDILEWISWWDQFKTCIHENDALGDRERFNYLRMYLKGSAKRAIEYIEVSSDNYNKAIEALKKRYGRKRIVVEHLVESILSIEKKEKLDARSLRYLYDTMVNRYHTLESHEPNLKYCHRIIVPILQSKLPQEVRKKWEYDLSKIENEEEDKKITVEYFFDFLRSHVMSEEASENSRKEPQERKNLKPRFTGTTSNFMSTATALTSNSKPDDQKTKQGNECAFCEKAHDSSRCYKIQKKSVDERLKLIKEKKLCFNCLRPSGPNHSSANCKVPGCLIEGCNKKHHVLLHRTSQRSAPTEANYQNSNSENQDSSIDQVVGHSGVFAGVMQSESQARLLPTALAVIHYNGIQLEVRVLVDSGSDHSYIRREVADALQLPSNGPLKSMTIFMHGGQAKTTMVKNVQFQLSPASDGNKKISFSAWSVNSVCSPLEPIETDLSNYTHLKGLNLADKFPRGSATIDILIGTDQLNQVLLNGLRKGPQSTPLGMNSIFGWLISGCIGHKPKSSNKITSVTNLAVVRLVEEEEQEETTFNLKKFWELESIGLVDKKRELSCQEEEALNQFNSAISYDGIRYEIGLPWRKNRPELLSNRPQALNRLVKIEKALSRDPVKEEMYKEAMQQYFKDGHAKGVTEVEEKTSDVYYLPHHPVFREDRTTTKCRIVFDASAKNCHGISLNDCLLPGPALQSNLVSLLLRFRLHKVAMMADIRKMFLQVKLTEKDQDFHRFLWRKSKDEQAETYCMTRITFGVISSPFEAIATIHHHAAKKSAEFPRAAKEVKENMYVDDYLSGEDTVNKAFSLHEEICQLMKTGGFEMVKWYTNSPNLYERIKPELRGPTTVVKLTNEMEPLKALGISWNTQEDVFIFTQGQNLLESEDQRTKRSLISIASKLFDPLGFLSPYTIRAKILFQELWLKGIKWDEFLDEDITEKWLQWKKELMALKDIKIPRSFGELNQIVDTQLHGFCDASTSAYGAVTYLRFSDIDGNVKTLLMMAKSKVAPTKRISLPRLELLAAYILSKLINFVLESIPFNITEPICWTDSMVSLAWIHQPTHKLKTFVANRVQAIQENVPPEQWRFCPGQQNPADLLTRGETLTSIADNSTWWYGPQWLKDPPDGWPEKKIDFSKQVDLETSQREVFLSEGKKIAVAMTGTTAHQSDAYIYELQSRYETWQRLMRIVAWLLKWHRLYKKSTGLGYLSAEEIKEAEFTLLRCVQQTTFTKEIEEMEQGKEVSQSSRLVNLDPQHDKEKNLLVVGGRLQFAQIPEEAKHQVIIPHKDPVIEKLILHIHVKASHAGPETTLAILRQRFWLIQGRREVKRVLLKCLICKHWKTKSVQQKMAPLPLERVQVAPPFTNVGLDFTGPLYLKVQGQSSLTKAYICIFVCEDTRAVHLELTNNMTTEEFLQAYRRMVNRRGMPRIIRSDNQTTFHKAAKVFKASKEKVKLTKIDPKEVESKLANDRVTWKFITERASHRGGHWERVCRQIKEPLRRVLGKALLTYSEMNTVLTDIEATINSRPLTYVGSDIRDGQVITPALLVIGRDLKTVPESPLTNSQVSLSDRYRYQQTLQNHFWNRWTKEYLPRLTLRQKWTNQTKPLKENDVVLITDDNIPRKQWKLGKILQAFPGSDGLIRTVKVMTRNGQVINRPVQKLHLLEEHQDVQTSQFTAECPINSQVHKPIQQSTIKVKSSKPRKSKNGIPPLVGEDVQSQIITKSGRHVKAPKRL